MDMTFSLALGSSQTGLNLQGQLIDTAGNNQGSPITSGFVEVGAGNYIFTSDIDSDFQGAIVFSDSDTDEVKAISDINPTPQHTLPDDALDSIMVEENLNARQALALISSAVAGMLLQPQASQVKTYAVGSGDSDERITATINSKGERLSITYNLPI